jgi:uncharacterized protein YodC (DUF2158 family)
MADFKVGEVVRLKSGGPKMTVEDPSKYDGNDWRVAVTWFDALRQDANQYCNREYFRADMLEREVPLAPVDSVT